ncbi:MAG: ParB N-terminal domain-containing protein [Nitrososphaerota archaeon]|nr:ParB N-terminal domain-containing protein [Nitrososphaerota archaeon]MDG7022904.1 ParB N-terminal domain-containing protein [Nitrososphaerota archaeon]
MALAKAGFVLTVKPVTVLRPHEETIPEHVRELAAEMQRDGVQRDPIIVDQDTATVLDGMHRLAAFGVLKIESAVCCSVDYSTKSVSVGRWARVYTMRKGDSAAESLGAAGMTRRVTLAEAFDALDSKNAGLAVLTSRAAYLPSGRMELKGAMDAIQGFDGQSQARGWERGFVPEDEIDVPLQSERNLVVLVRRLGKDDVVAAGRSGKLFPCKTSMHRIDPRPVAVNFPLSALNDATTASLRKALEGRSERLLPPDSMYEGRRYKERLLLLNQE